MQMCRRPDEARRNDSTDYEPQTYASEKKKKKISKHNNSTYLSLSLKCVYE